MGGARQFLDPVHAEVQCHLQIVSLYVHVEIRLQGMYIWFRMRRAQYTSRIRTRIRVKIVNPENHLVLSD